MDHTEILEFIRCRIRTCDRLMDYKTTTYCVCCENFYDNYYFKHTHKQTRIHTRNHTDLINDLCNIDDERVVDIILYIVDNN
jgi:hypothetical protein